MDSDTQDSEVQEIEARDLRKEPRFERAAEHERQAEAYLDFDPEPEYEPEPDYDPAPDYEAELDTEPDTAELEAVTVTRARDRRTRARAASAGRRDPVSRLGLGRPRGLLSAGLSAARAGLKPNRYSSIRREPGEVVHVVVQVRTSIIGLRPRRRRRSARSCGPARPGGAAPRRSSTLPASAW